MAYEDQDFVVVNDQDLVDYNPSSLLPQSPSDILKIRQWLQPTDYEAESSEYNKHLASFVPGTAEWILLNEQYKAWIRSSDCDTLWLKGVAGSGKSVIAAHVAMLVSREKVPVLRFFFRQIISTNKTPESLLRDWLAQLLGFSPLLQLKLKNLLDDRRTLDSMAFDELWDILVLAMSERQRVYCIVDAVDEMDLDNENFLRKLTELGQTKSSTVKVFITSRPLPYLEKSLSKPSISQILLQSHLVDPDISIYVRAQLSRTKLPVELQSKIENVLGERSQGLFLYARLMLDEILELGVDFSEVDDTLQKLPFGLSQLYTRMLHDHSLRAGTPQEIQLLILQSVTHSSRPLRLLELAAITDFIHQESDHPTIPLKQAKFPDTKSIIRRGCGPLLEILEDETVSIIHHSLTEFLVDPQRCKTNGDAKQFPVISTQETNLIMAKLCIKYLLMVSSGLQPDPESFDIISPKLTPDNARLAFPFLDYAVQNLDYHILRISELSKDLIVLLDGLFAAGPSMLASYLALSGPLSAYGKTSSLHIVASKGLAAYAKHLVKLGQDANCLDGEQRTPLHYAAANGHTDAVEGLLQCGASNNPDDRTGLTPLHLSAKADHFGVVKKLLKSGVDPLPPKTKEDPGNWCGNAPRSKGTTAVEYASSFGHTKTIVEFIPYLDTEGLGKALGWALNSGKTETALAILKDPRVDINKVTDGKTPIHIASHSHDLKSMHRLLQLGADVNIKCNSLFRKTGVRAMSAEDLLKYSPLHAYAKAYHGRSADAAKKGFRLLLDAGCDINEYDGTGRTVLHMVLYKTRWTKAPTPVEIVEFLVDNGADPSLATKDGSTVLHCGSDMSEEMVEFVVAHGANVNARRPKDGRTPLFGAADPISLIKFGADCNAQDNEGNTPLHVALEGYSPPLPNLKALLNNGSNPNIRNKKGNTVLHILKSSLGQDELVRMLVAAKADLEAKTLNGRTVLLEAIENGRDIRGIESLLDVGADINARDFEGATVLHYCGVKEKSVDMMRLLIERGADPFCKDYSGNTLFHQVAMQQPAFSGSEQQSLLNFLLELGLSPSARNNEGQTPFHFATGMYQGDQSWLSDKPSPYKYLLGPRCNLDVNTADDHGVRPIHFAASLHEHQVRRLLDEGADPAVFTLEGLSPLHVASRSRQSNIVGMLVDEYIKRGQHHVIERQDIEGRTALHHAARSGRSETVAILLSLGSARADVKDGKGLTPLDVCSEVPEEDMLWQTSKHDYRVAFIRAPPVKLSEKNRPYGGDSNRKSDKGEIASEADTIGTREIMRLLVSHGADISFMLHKDLRNTYARRPTNAFELALVADCESMADELLVLSQSLKLKELSDQKEDDTDEFRYYLDWNHFVEKYVLLRSQSSPSFLKDIVKPGDNNLQIFHSLLRAENERGIAEFKDLGADLLKPEWDGKSCITLLVRWGYASLLKKYGKDAAAMTDKWIEETEESDPSTNLIGRLKHPLLIASERKISNLDVIKVLVEDFGVNVNARSKEDHRKGFQYSTPIHYLATSQHWWYSRALEYLLQHGVNQDIKNEAIHAAIASKRGEVTTEILLRHGADPNFIDEDGNTCLNKASKHPSIVRDLIKYGANASAGKKPFVFDAIEALDLATINLLVEMKTNLNLKPEPEKEPEFGPNEHLNWLNYQQYILGTKELPETSYPIHFAASTKFNTPDLRPKILPIIDSLLRGGADPFQSYNDKGDSILHELCLNEGIIEPLLSLPRFDAEARDSEGRTLLLVACSTDPDYYRQRNSASLGSSAVQILLAKGADVTAIDNDGRNVLHHFVTCSKHGYWLRASDTKDFEYILSLDPGSQLAVQKDLSGATPLHHALRAKQLWAVDPLLAQGASPFEPDPEGNSALHHLASQLTIPGDSNSSANTLFPKFLSLGADINAVNNLGETPLCALVSGPGICLQNVLMLEQKGADLNIRNKKGQGLLHMIAARNTEKGNNEHGEKSKEIAVFKYLMERGLDAVAEDKESRSSLDVAVANGISGIVDIFKRDSK